MQHCLTFSEAALIGDEAAGCSISLFTNIPPSSQRERLRALFYSRLGPDGRDFIPAILQSYSFHSMIWYLPNGLPMEGEGLPTQVFPFKARSLTCRGQWFHWTRQMVFDWTSHTVWFFVEDIEVERYMLPIRRGFLGIPMHHPRLPLSALVQKPSLQLFRFIYQLSLVFRHPILPRMPIRLGFEDPKWIQMTTEVWHHRTMLRSDSIQVMVDESPTWSTRPSSEILGESMSTIVGSDLGAPQCCP
jgi:hypothetical protein